MIRSAHGEDRAVHQICSPVLLVSILEGSLRTKRIRRTGYLHLRNPSSQFNTESGDLLSIQSTELKFPSLKEFGH
ncbi:hypothetical protein RchiOBHm_Chr1g0318031 [Rosa chinensis]|uniref:Uncharacterized protein n=1 Tax=Rosa chinensis TaxID=74649 RepID=A0A2P6S822_ROSCH|nr:hypothetical protein RchiOBHm_Chr1g0318031 [Rosa chinensis]